MDASQLFYIVASVSLLAIVALLTYLVFQIVVTLKTIRTTISHATNIADNIKSVTTGVQFGFWALLTNLIRGVRGGGK